MNDIHPDLTALLRGELTNAAAVKVAEHARDCESCRAGLVDDALGHGLLAGARRTLGRLDEARSSTSSSLPPELRQRITARRRLRPALLGGAVAAALVVVAGVGVAVGARLGDDGASGGAAAAVQQTATLEPVEGNAHGRVSMGTDHAITRMELATRALPRAPRGEFYYAWLFDPRTNKMLPLGQVTPGRVATFEIPHSLVTAYSAIDVSLEADDGDPGHSVTSVLRATYGDDAGEPS